MRPSIHRSFRCDELREHRPRRQGSRAPRTRARQAARTLNKPLQDRLDAQLGGHRQHRALIACNKEC